MNCALEFHDSRVASVASARGTVSVNFIAAYLHKSEGMPGIDDGSGWVQQGKLEFIDAGEIEGLDIGEGWLMEGSIAVQSGEPSYMLPVPFDAAGGVSVSLSFSNGSVVQFNAEAARLTLIGEAEFVEEFRRA